MSDLFDDTLKRGAKVGRGSAESIKPYGEKKKSKSNDANRYSYPYAYRRPKGSTSLQVLRRHRPDELQGMSNFTAILYYFVGTFWCLLLSFLLWLHIYADPVYVEQIVRNESKGEPSTLRQLNIYVFVEKSGVTEDQTSYVKTLLGKKAMERLLVHTKGNHLSGNCVVINLLHINDKITTYGTVVEGNNIDYSQVSRAMNMLAPMCIEKCNNTDGWIDDFEDEIGDPNRPASNGSLDSVDIETRELGKVTAYYRKWKKGFDIGRIIAHAYNCTQEALSYEQSSPEMIRLGIYECARSTAKIALHEFIGKYGKGSNGNDYDITHATVCVAGALMKKTKLGPPTGINPLNIAVACSDNKRNNKFVLGIPVSLVWQDSEGATPKVLTFLGSGGYSVLERTVRRILIFTWANELANLRGYPETYYDPFGNRTIVDDITSEDQLFEQGESAPLSGLPLHERIQHMSHLLVISGTGVYDENEVYADEEGCYYNCTYRFPGEFTEVPSENDNVYFY